MRSFVRFVRTYLVGTLSLAVGALLSIYGLLSDAYSLVTIGLAPMALAAIGASVFFVSILALLYTWHRDHIEPLARYREAAPLDQQGPLLAAEPRWASIDAERYDGWENDLAIVRNQHFQNTEVVLDGHYYTNCTFENVTFVYNGGLYQLSNSNIKGRTIRSDRVGLGRFAELMLAFGVIEPGVQWHVGKSGPVPHDEHLARFHIFRGPKKDDQ